MTDRPRFFPSYGVPNISKLRANGMAYVDKTRFIRPLEAANEPCVLMVRPRRFGKTLFCSVLAAYYDEAKIYLEGA